jgi:hypothetical protein
MKYLPTVVTGIFCLSLLVAGAPQAQAQAGNATSGSVTESVLADYAQDVVRSNSDDIKGYESTRMTVEAPLSYLVHFTTDVPEMLTKEVARGDEGGYMVNAAITEHWQGMFCTDPLNALMQEHHIFMISGTLLDASGNRHSTAVCIVK